MENSPNTIPIYQVDSFTTKPFAGNPAGACLLPKPASEAWMQALAREMNLSETAFLVQRQQGDGFDLRWFTPAVEVDLCGHATLASAHILWEAGILGVNQPARFHTRSGILTCARQGDWISMDFPATPAKETAAPEGLAFALGVTPRYVGASRFDYLVEVDTEATVRNLKPDFARLVKLPVRGVMVTSKASTPGFDFVSRFFAPQVGINEDPVTGSAHCTLTPYWSNLLDKDSLTAYQASARGGVVKVRLNGDRVVLSGQAVTVFTGQLSNVAIEGIFPGAPA
jgi:PhzF family phenazine biosynthesis protein